MTPISNVPDYVPMQRTYVPIVIQQIYDLQHKQVSTTNSYLFDWKFHCCIG